MDKYRDALVDLLSECFYIDGYGDLHWSYIEGEPANGHVKPETLDLIKEMMAGTAGDRSE